VLPLPKKQIKGEIHNEEFGRPTQMDFNATRVIQSKSMDLEDFQRRNIAVPEALDLIH